MTSVQIRLTSVQEIRSFVEKVCRYNNDVDLSSGRYIVDAKSIMGIFSLDLANPVTVTIHGDDYEVLLYELDEYVIK